MRLLFFLPLFVVCALGAQKVHYDGFEVHRVIPQTNEQLEALKILQESGNGFSFWIPPAAVNRPVDIMVAPHLKALFSDFIELQKMNTQLMMKNVEEEIVKSNPKGSRAFGWEEYYDLDGIYAWLDELAATNEFVTVISGGTSYEGRDLKGIKISYSSANENKGVFIEGGIHAREWISPAVVTYVVNELLNSPEPSVRQIAESHDWYVFPNVNPDGYVYTHTTDRMWRKTRQPYGSCYGADPNRNWAYHWMDGGASDNPCSETHAGSEPFSEPEMKSLSEYITTISDKLVYYLAFHSYSQLLLIPYGHSSEHVENYDELYEVGLLAADSLGIRYGTQYTVGNIVEVIYVASGGSMDWVKGNYGTRVTYTWELRDTGRYGFLLPPEQIIPTGEETFDSIVRIFEEFKTRL